MKLSSLALPAAALLLALAPKAAAQQTTEQFIPVGKSPGLSDTYTYIGEIQASDSSSVTMTREGAGGPYVVTIDADTRIWLDRSKIRRTAGYGLLEDLVVGRTIEVKFRDPESHEHAEWIKVVVPEE